ncbi:MAG TPA: alpha/beta fold hydrolase [Kofleriaceae bacterium]|nr:alpha/beta fold hydrolase [Kofleriaceae bacterium]
MSRFDAKWISTLVVIAAAAACGSPQSPPRPAPAAPPPAAPPAAPAPKIDGVWSGALDVGIQLRLVFHLEHGADGALHATLDSPDQSAEGLPVTTATFEAGTLHLVLDELHAEFVGKLEGEQIAGTFTQGGRSKPLALARGDGAPRRPQQPHPPFPYREREVKLSVLAQPLAADARRADAAHILLTGTLTVPPGDGPFPAVLLVTGSGPQDRDETLLGHKPFLLLADTLTRHGIATLRFDDRGVGKSGGTTTGATTLDLVEDALREVDWLAAQPEIDRRAVGVLGHSEGAAIGPIVATRDPRARFVVMLAGPGLPGDQVLISQGAALERASGKPGDAIAREEAAQRAFYDQLKRARTDADADAAARAYVDADPAARKEREALGERIRRGWRWFQTFVALDPAPYLARVRVPVLAIAGARDLQVVPENLPAIEAALRRGHNPDATVQLLPDLNHLFQHTKTGLPTEYGEIEETFAPEALQLVTDWIVARTARR